MDKPYCIVQVGDLVWRTKDPALEAAARATYEGLSGAQKRKLPVHISVLGRLGQVMRLRLQQHPGALQLGGLTQALQAQCGRSAVTRGLLSPIGSAGAR